MTGVHKLNCPNGCDIYTPGGVILCDDMTKGPFYCPHCKSQLGDEMDEELDSKYGRAIEEVPGAKLEIDSIEVIPLMGSELNTELIQMLMDKIKELEAHIKELEPKENPYLSEEDKNAIDEYEALRNESH